VLVRHAKAVDIAASDLERALTERGKANAAEIGSHLAAVGVVPDVALVSTALRTQQTWQQLREAAGWELTHTDSDAFYSAGTDSTLDLIHELPETAHCAVLVGHNPTVALLAHLLDSGTGDPEVSMSQASGGYPPGSVSILEFDGSWWDVREGRGTLTGYHVGGRAS
jgi:phosphohistidine phosphatase